MAQTCTLILNNCKSNMMRPLEFLQRFVHYNSNFLIPLYIFLSIMILLIIIITYYSQYATTTFAWCTICAIFFNKSTINNIHTDTLRGTTLLFRFCLLTDATEPFVFCLFYFLFFFRPFEPLSWRIPDSRHHCCCSCLHA